MTAFGRPEYLKRAIEALRTCVGISKYTLIVAIDPAPNPTEQKHIRELVENITFCKCTPIFNDSRLGLNRNTLKVLDVGFSMGEFVVHVESDVLLGPDALQYFEYCESKYRNDPATFSVTAINNMPCTSPDDYIIHERRQWFSCSGWGTWADRWKGTGGIVSNWGNDPKSWAPHLNLNVRGDRCEIYPRLSRSINIGVEGENTPSVEYFNKYCLISSWSGDNRWFTEAIARGAEWRAKRVNDSIKSVLIIPAFNEAPRIGHVLEIAKHAKLVSKIVVADDGSTDGTAARAKGFVVFRQPRNEGKWKAVGAVVRAINADIYITIDADLCGFKAEDIDGLVYPHLENEILAMTVARCNFNGTTSMDSMGHGSIHTVTQNISGQRAYKGEFLKSALLVAEEIVNRHPGVVFRYTLEHCANLMAIRRDSLIQEVPFGYNINNPSKTEKWGKEREDIFLREMAILDRETYGKMT